MTNEQITKVLEGYSYLRPQKKYVGKFINLLADEDGVELDHYKITEFVGGDVVVRVKPANYPDEITLTIHKLDPYHTAERVVRYVKGLVDE